MTRDETIVLLRCPDCGWTIPENGIDPQPCERWIVDDEAQGHRDCVPVQYVPASPPTGDEEREALTLKQGDRFWIRWRDGRYLVTVPALGDCEVVRAEAYDRLASLSSPLTETGGAPTSEQLRRRMADAIRAYAASDDHDRAWDAVWDEVNAVFEQWAEDDAPSPENATTKEER